MVSPTARLRLGRTFVPSGPIQKSSCTAQAPIRVPSITLPSRLMVRKSQAARIIPLARTTTCLFRVFPATQRRSRLLWFLVTTQRTRQAERFKSQ